MSLYPELLETEIARNREAEVLHALGNLGLSPAHIKILHVYNARQPYHNYQHAYCVALGAYDAGVLAGLDFGTLRLTFLAGLYHDFAHPAAIGTPDIFNVVKAVQDSRYYLGLKEPWLTPMDRARVAELILSTEASHRRPPLDEAAETLMDADLLATDQPDREAWLVALGQELGGTFDDTGTARFIQAHTFYSVWGRLHADDYLRRLTR